MSQAAYDHAEKIGAETLRRAVEEGWGRRRLSSNTILTARQARTLLKHLKKGNVTLEELLDHLSGSEVEEVDEEFNPNQYLANKVFVDEDDNYHFYLRSAPSRLEISGEVIRSMKRAYSNWDGNEETINEICRKFDLPRSWFIEIKETLGWTHDSDPFTDKEIVERDHEEMAEEVLQRERNALYQIVQRKRHRQMEEAAENWWNFRRSVLEPLTELLQEELPGYQPPTVNIHDSPGSHALVFPPFDLHFGKETWVDETGESYSREEAEDLLVTKTEQILNRASRVGHIERIVCPLGSDWFHIDTDQGTSTQGTVQDIDGTPARILREGSFLAAKLIDMLRQVAPVEIHHVEGNHDRLNSLSVVLFVLAWFRDKSDVQVHSDPGVRKYADYGETLFGFTHGDMSKKMKKQLPAIMAEEAKEIWGRTEHRAMFTGHLHHEMLEDRQGVTLYQLPSLSAADRWHDREGYKGSRRALCGYMAHKKEGIICNLISPVLGTKNRI